jgi:glutamine synthetase
MTTAKDVLKMIKDNDVKYVDFRFTDPRGKWQHVTFDVTMIEDDTFAEGIMFDGSSIAGWKAINESDMCLMPDPATACIDPFFAETTLVLVCDVLEPTTGKPKPWSSPWASATPSISDRKPSSSFSTT